MEGSVSPGPAERKRLLALYRKHPDAEVRRRAHIVLLLSDGWSWSSIAAVLYCSSRTIDRWKRRYQESGAAGLLGRARGRAALRPGGGWRCWWAGW